MVLSYTHSSIINYQMVIPVYFFLTGTNEAKYKLLYIYQPIGSTAFL